MIKEKFMKKILLTVCVCLTAVFTANAQPFTWAEVVNLFSQGVEEGGEAMEKQFADMGIGMNINTAYDKATKTYEVILYFKDPSIVEGITQQILESGKASFIIGFMQTTINESGKETLIEIMKAMEREHGKIKVVYSTRSNGKTLNKEAIITADDMRSIAARQFGISY